MQVSEIFYSLQGEGVNIGKPSIFLRLSGCHLRCSWCDTKYTWPLISGKKMSITDIIKAIKKFPCKNLVITGGEPLIQQEELKKLLTKLPNYYIEIETSGSIKSKLGRLVNHYNCSPKLSNSNNKEINFKKFPKNKSYFKFVVDNQKDLKEINSFIREHRLPREKVILMPQGIDAKKLLQKSKWLAEICKKENLRFTPRLQVDLWGNTKGT